MLTPFNRIYSIELDINGLEDVHLTHGKFTNGDRQTSTVLVRLIKDGAPLDLTDATITAFFDCSDGSLYRQGTTILDPAGGIVGVDLKSDVLIVGINAMALRVEKPNVPLGNTDIMYSPNMTYTVYRTILDGIESDDRLPIIEEILDNLNTSMDELGQLKDQIIEKIEEVEDLKNSINMDGFVRSVTVNGQQYNAVNNNVTLPDYPTNYAGSNAPGGAANTAIKLDSPVNINGVAFDGSADITVEDNTKVKTSSNTVVNENVVIYDGTTGKLIKDSGFTLKKSVPADAKFTDTVYVHPPTHNPNEIATDTNNRFVTDAEKTDWNNKETTTGSQEKADKALEEANKYTDEKITDLVNSAPTTLDTLKELADALGNDPNFATTITTQIGNKADKDYVDNQLAEKANKSDLDSKAELSYVTQELDKKADLNHTHTSNQVTAMTGYVKKTDKTPILATDTLNEAISKLEKSIDDLEAGGGGGTGGGGTTGGNADTATKLQTPRKINGTLFDGTQDITTEEWGTAREVSITDNDGANTGAVVSVNGGSNVQLKLPSTIKADLDGNSTTSDFAERSNTATTADTANKLEVPRKINGTNFDGSADITTVQWGTTRNIKISDNDETNSGDSVSVNGSNDYTLKLPATIKATLNGKADAAGESNKLTTAREISITNDANGSVNFDGSSDVEINLNLSTTGVTAGNYGPNADSTTNTVQVPFITVDEKGRITSAETKTITVPQSTGGGGATTDTMVTNTKNNTAKAYVTGTTTSTTNTGTQVFDDTVYLDSEEGTLVAKKFKGELDGNAATSTHSDFATESNTANTADQLTTARDIQLTGDINGTASFDGSTNITINSSLATINKSNTTSTANPNYGESFTAIGNVTVDTKGRLTGVETKTITLPNATTLTDEKVKNEKNNTTKAYITGTTNADTNTGTQVFDTGVYLDVEEGTLVANKFKGNVDGSATSADKLKDPVNITIGNTTKPFDGSAPLEWTENDLGLDGYLPLTGGTVTGSTTFEKGIISPDVCEIKAIRSTEKNPTTGFSYWSLSSTGTLSCQNLDIATTSLLKGQVTLHNTIRGLKTDGSQSWSVDRNGNSVFDTLTVNQQAKCFAISSTLPNPPWSISDSGIAKFNSIGSYTGTNVWNIDGGGQATLQKADINGTTTTVDLKVTQNGVVGGTLDVTGAIYGTNNITLNRGNVYTPIFNSNVLTDYLRMGEGFLNCTDGGVFHFIKNGAASSSAIANGNIILPHAQGQSVLCDYIRLGNSIIASPASGTIHMQKADAATTTLYVGGIINNYSISKTSTVSNENEESALDKINSVEVVNTNEGFRLTKGIEGNSISPALLNEETGEEEINVDLNTAIATLWKAIQELKKENEELKNKLGM